MSLTIAIVFLIWIVIEIVSTLSAWRYTWGLPRAEIPGRTPSVAIIVAIKNRSAVAAEFLIRLRAQAYPDYRIIAAVESTDDPAFALLREAEREPGARIVTIVAGPVQHGGQKVWNLLAALKAITPADEIIAFTDADTLPSAEWLPRLVSSLTDAGYDAVTGYRWMIPTDGRISSAVVAAANASIVTTPRIPAVINLCWGGAMALPQTTLERIDIGAYWRGAISDDLQMTRALGAARCAIFSPRQSLLLSPVEMGWEEAFAFGRRQYRLMLTHVPLLWLFAAFVMAMPAVAAIAAAVLALQGYVGAIAALIFSIGLGELRYWNRRRIVRALWPETAHADLATYWRVERFMRPLWHGFHLVCIFAALGSRRISWAGFDYLVRSPQDVVVLSRPTARD
ncbi:glycosyltransferase family 2 protein [Methylocella silvestris]|uniref:Glycosyl transferase n=1 Tax=Methylocella silvestris TaxID=199596 RepID=A0A2J7TFU1_METSI|nr:glycosyltransferase family 2 protein [Methylocella silvestris]PNG25644.1 glycosyl transferase [Methylocella silvestris]